MTHLSTKYSPGFIRFRYTGSTIPHTAKFGIKFSEPPEAGTDAGLSTKGGDAVAFSEAIHNYVDVAFKLQFDDTTDFGFADLYSVDPDTGLQTFIYTTNLALSGTNVGENVPLVESVWVFKSSVGKPIKVYAMEAVYAADARNIGVVPADARQEILDYVLSSENIIYGATDAWPIAFQTFTSKENDVLRRRSGFYNA